MKRIENFLNWFNHHCIDIVITMTFISSCLPFILPSHGGAFYALIGTMLGALLAIYAYWDYRDKIKQSAFTTIFGVIIVWISIISIIILVCQNKSHLTTPLDHVYCIYTGVAIGGCFITAAIEVRDSEKSRKNANNKKRTN